MKESQPRISTDSHRSKQKKCFIRVDPRKSVARKLLFQGTFGEGLSRDQLKHRISRRNLRERLERGVRLRREKSLDHAAVARQIRFQNFRLLGIRQRGQFVSPAPPDLLERNLA